MTKSELERLAILAEECGEVQQIIGKIIRHGYESYNPTVPDKGRPTNRRLLERELGDLNFIINMMIKKKDVDSDEIIIHRNTKAKKIEPYLHHNKI